MQYINRQERNTNEITLHHYGGNGTGKTTASYAIFPVVRGLSTTTLSASRFHQTPLIIH
jgi:hypothetical protein